MIFFSFCRKMAFKCCISNCKGNYNAENKVSVFAFSKDLQLRMAWLHSILRKVLIWTKICEYIY